jgi:hypothetical protein
MAAEVLGAMLLLFIHLTNYLQAVGTDLEDSLHKQDTNPLPRTETEIACSLCDRNVTVTLRVILTGQLCACPHCGAVMTFKATDSAKAQELLERAKHASTRVSLKIEEYNS